MSGLYYAEVVIDCFVCGHEVHLEQGENHGWHCPGCGAGYVVESSGASELTIVVKLDASSRAKPRYESNRPQSASYWSGYQDGIHYAESLLKELNTPLWPDKADTTRARKCPEEKQ